MREWGKEYLENRGFPSAFSTYIVNKVVFNFDSCDHDSRDDSMSQYSIEQKAAFIRLLREYAANWIHANHPTAWYLVHFVDEPTGI